MCLLNTLSINSIKNKTRSISSCLLLVTTTILVSACGGGGGGSNALPAAPPAAFQPTPSPTNSSWTQGIFEPDSNFKSLCENPRSGFSEVTGDPFDDMNGATLDENNWLRSWVNDTYLWYDEVTDRDPSLYATTGEYFPLLKTEAITASGKDKDEFHFTVPTDEWEALSLTGSSSGYGATIAIVASTPPREAVVLYTQPGSSAASVNLGRGARILEIDGEDLINGNNVNKLNAGLSPQSDGETHRFVIRDFGATETREITMISGPVTSTPVLETSTIDTPTGKVGYILFNDHIATAEQGLVDAIEQLSAEGIVDLVLDLRYNGGGFLAIASQMAYMVAGETQTSGRTFEALKFNDKHPTFNPVTGNLNDPVPFYNSTLGFSISQGSSLPTLDLPRLYVITTSNTCSASESIINGLRGVDMEVVLIGSTTCGKPYGFYATDNCGTTYFSVQFQAANDAGFGEFADGFAPNNSSSAGTVSLPGCFVEDDLESPLGEASEPMLAQALQYRETGGCAAVSGKSSESAQGKAQTASSEAVMIKSAWLKNKILSE